MPFRWVIFLLFLHCACAMALPSTLRVERLGAAQGLSQNSVNAMAIDKQGFLWIGTFDGLNRYDGYNFKHFSHHPDSTSGLSSSVITALHVDSDGILWIGTRSGGLNRYDPQTGQIEYFRYAANDPSSISHDDVMSIDEDAKGNLWLGTLGGGVNHFNVKTERFTRYVNDPTSLDSLSDNTISTIMVDSKDNVWVGTTNKGLNRFDPNSKKFTRFVPEAQDANSLNDTAILSLLEDSLGHIWIGTNNGLSRYTPDTRQFKHFKVKPGDVTGLTHGSVQALYEDVQGRIWLGTTVGGINIFSPKEARFYSYQHDISDPHSLSDQNIQVILGDDKGLIWAGSFGAGLNKFDLRTVRFGHQKHLARVPGSLGPGHIWSFYQANDDTLYVASSQGVSIGKKGQNSYQFLTHNPSAPNDPYSLPHPEARYVAGAPNNQVWIATDGGLSLYNPVTQKMKHYSHDDDDPKSLSNNVVSYLWQEQDGPLWAGTFGGGLNRFDMTTETFTHYTYDALDPYSLSSDEVSAMYRDSHNVLWVATWKGLNRFDPENGRFIRYGHDPDNPSTLRSHFVTAVLEDSAGRLWIATYGGGLSLYRRQTDDFIHYNVSDGLANNSVNGLLEDRHGKLWMSTNVGISRFDVNVGTFINFNEKDGLQGNEFNTSAFYRTRDGRLMFGGVNGFNLFDPDDIVIQRQPPDVILTELLLINQQVGIRKGIDSAVQGVLLDKPLNQLDSLQLNYRHDLITFEFAALDFTNPMKLSYAYRLLGAEQNWIPTDARNRRATYTDLAPGDYELQVKASYGDGYWSQNNTSFKLHVEPPPWNTWWAKTLYALLALAIIAYSYRAHKRSVAQAYAISQQLQKVDKLKDEFLANTSHELRTPLNGIIGLAESLIDGAAGKLPEQANRNLAMLVGSGKRLANLVNDIMDFSKIKSAHLSVSPKPVDLRAMVEVVLALSRHMSASKGLKLVNDLENDLPAVNADEARLQQILHNLVGNAIKFTPSGQVVVSAKLTGNWMSICVSDTGIGIPAEHFERIFESFEQIEGGTERAYGGTGLGLSLTRKLVELHGGSIEVDSTEGVGSTFRFTLPVSDEPLEQTQEKYDALPQAVSMLHHLPEQFEPSDEVPVHAQGSEHNSRFKILLVDDELVNRQVLHNHLSMHYYQLCEAENGQQAIEAVERQGPFDLILLDIMMPGMSGYQVCETLRQKHNVHELPILFLTAKNQVIDLVHGFEVGANDYLSKPVSKAELLARVDTHLSLLDINRNLELKVLERTESLKQATDAKSDFLAKMSHEIRTPMNAVIGLSRLVLKSNIPKQQSRHVEQILDAGESLLGLINDILDFSKIEAGKLVIEHIEFCLCDVVKKAVNLSMLNAHIKGLELVTYIAPNVPDRLIGDPLRIQQIIVNLVNNAVKFTDAGLVCINVALAQTQQKDGLMLECSVQDTGPGMSSQQQSKLFQNFAQADETVSRTHGGTGLGLAISRQLSELMGGRIWLQSKEGTGSTFFFTIKVQTADTTEQVALPSLDDLKILLIDDKPLAANTTLNTLQGLNVKTQVSSSCDKAISLLGQQHFDLLIINGQMQQDAIALLTRLRVHCENVPNHLFTITPYIREEFQLRSVDTGPHQLLEKPLFTADWHRAIAHLTGRHKAQPEPHKPQLPSVPNLTGNNILLVEDNAINRQVALGFLVDTGAAISCAEDGLQALDKMRHGRFDLVLMDLEMPNMNGLTACRRIRHSHLASQMPIIAMTGHVSFEAICEAKQAGMNDHLAKPLEPDCLFSLLSKYLKANNKNTVVAKGQQSMDIIDQLSQVEGIEAAQALAKMGGRRNLYLDLVKDFGVVKGQLPKQLIQLYESQAWDELYRTIHSLKSNAAYIGAFQLSKLSATVEDAYGEGHHDRQLLNQLCQTLTPLIGQLQTLFANTQSAPEDNTLDTQCLKQLLEQIQPMLKKSDIAVESYLPQLQQICEDSDYALQVDVLIASIEELEYEKAAKLAQALCAGLSEVVDS